MMIYIFISEHLDLGNDIKKKHTREGVEERTVNTNKDETLGLPPGTIRGTLALTLLMGALAMTISALGMENTLEENTFLVDNFNFLKTAFLMMIAFYFGNKSLEKINWSGPRIRGREAAGGEEESEVPVTPSADAARGRQILKEGKLDADTATPETWKESDSADFDNPRAVQ